MHKGAVFCLDNPVFVSRQKFLLILFLINGGVLAQSFLYVYNSRLLLYIILNRRCDSFVKYTSKNVSPSLALWNTFQLSNIFIHSHEVDDEKYVSVSKFVEILISENIKRTLFRNYWFIEKVSKRIWFWSTYQVVWDSRGVYSWVGAY
jgi:hypothetical protein